MLLRSQSPIGQTEYHLTSAGLGLMICLLLDLDEQLAVISHQVYVGHWGIDKSVNHYGLQKLSWHLFNRSLSALTLDETIELVVAIWCPHYYNTCTREQKDEMIQRWRTHYYVPQNID